MLREASQTARKADFVARQAAVMAGWAALEVMMKTVRKKREAMEALVASQAEPAAAATAAVGGVSPASGAGEIDNEDESEFDHVNQEQSAGVSKGKKSAASVAARTRAVDWWCVPGDKNMKVARAGFESLCALPGLSPEYVCTYTYAYMC